MAGVTPELTCNQASPEMRGRKPRRPPSLPYATQMDGTVDMATLINIPETVDGSGYNEVAAIEMVGRARELRPLIESYAPWSDENGRLHADVVSSLKDAGFWDMALPRRWGGYGTSAKAMALVGAELAKADGSVGWVYTVFHGTTWVASLTNDNVQEAIFGDGSKPVLCGIANPPGKLEPVDGGYLLSGRWPYSSGCYHADWAQLGCNIHHPDGRIEHGGNAYVRMNDVTIENTWHMMGMKGTGSNTIVVDKHFIPDFQFQNLVQYCYGMQHPNKRHVGEPSDYWPFMPFLRATAHAVVGGAANSILERVADASRRRPIVYTTYGRQADCVTAQAEFGRAAAKIAAAEAMTVKNCEIIDRVGMTRVPMTPIERAQSKGEGSVAVELASQAVDTLMFLAGSSAFADSNPLQRLYRDCVFAMRHTANLPYVGYEIFGKALLGIEPNIAPQDFI